MAILLFPYRVFVNTLVNATAAVESGVIDMRRAEAVSLTLRATSVAGTAVDVKIEYAISADGVTFGSFADYTDLIANIQTLFSGTVENVHVVAITLVQAPFIKFLVTGIASNAADTLVTMDLNCEELN